MGKKIDRFIKVLRRTVKEIQDQKANAGRPPKCLKDIMDRSPGRTPLFHLLSVSKATKSALDLVDSSGPYENTGDLQISSHD